MNTNFLTPSILILVVLLALVWLWLRMKFKRKPPALKYQKRRLFTKTETRFLFLLDEEFGSEFRILGKIRIADVILPRTGLKREEWGRLFGKISSKHLDYVLADKVSMRPLCAIELNDKSHTQKNRKERDAFVAGALKSAGLPIVWVKEGKKYNMKQVGDEVRSKIQHAGGKI